MKNFHHTENCPIRDILSRLSSKWAMLILITLDAKNYHQYIPTYALGDFAYFGGRRFNRA